MKTYHQVFLNDARNLRRVSDESIDLVVTSSPYPMVEMWDAAFTAMNPLVGRAINAGDGRRAFELMHRELDNVWRECVRVLKPGGLICINIGDAVRNLSADFQMYSNHARIVNALCGPGLIQLPDILWHKPTNAPNKFMGSGMLPGGAYVTYEHEYILIFRKGHRRVFKTSDEKQNRRASAFFWEERNRWFSDVWTDLNGTPQGVTNSVSRGRSAAYPFELAYRLICMHSVYGDTILDPFLGTGTTMAASIAASRNSVGVEIDEAMEQCIRRTLDDALTVGTCRVRARLEEHQKFISNRLASGLAVKYQNSIHNFAVMTAQETEAVLYEPVHLSEQLDKRFQVISKPIAA